MRSSVPPAVGPAGAQVVIGGGRQNSSTRRGPTTIGRNRVRSRGPLSNDAGSTSAECRTRGYAVTRRRGRLVVARRRSWCCRRARVARARRRRRPRAPIRFRRVLNGRGHYLHRGSNGEADVNVCSERVAPGIAHCDAHVRTDLFGKDAQPRRRARAPAARTSRRARQPGRVRPGVPAVGVQRAVGHERRRARPSRSSTRTTPRTPRATSRCTARSSACPPCTTANGCFTQGQPERRHAATRRPTPAGRRRSRSTSTW